MFMESIIIFCYWLSMECRHPFADKCKKTWMNYVYKSGFEKKTRIAHHAHAPCNCIFVGAVLSSHKCVTWTLDKSLNFKE